MLMTLTIFPGQSFPLGATVYPDGINFCVFSKNCHAVELLLFDAPDDKYPRYTIALDPQRNRTFYYWHVFVKGLQAGQIYAYRVHGPFAPEQGLRFDGSKVLLDPYARAVVTNVYEREAALRPGDNCAHALRAAAVDPIHYDWEGDTPLNLPYSDTVIYELHLAGFTRNPNSGLPSHLRGTYTGLIEKIPYLKDLGITAVELLPVQHFDDQDIDPPLSNYWGYNPIAFFAPHAGYSSIADPLGPVNEFRQMVKALHRAGIEVILDVVFNHSAEGDHRGPTLSFRGFENRAYYILDRNPAYYMNYSGCGNSMNGNHSIVRRMIMDCLRYWVSEMHVDGFRFDLASVMARDEWGNPLENPPILWEIESDPVLAGTKIIAEAWDAVGLYQVGSFIGHRWAEWNGHYRDDVRRFVKGDEGMVSIIANRLCASPDLYPQPEREPNRSINFITCHDGFTLNDLVSYNDKHNEANGEDNRDGTKVNYSWNCGTEGPTTDQAVEALRQRQLRNFFSMLLFAQGTPMLLMGDEVRRTQQGNNNAYCQDNELSWFDWDLVAQNRDLLRFVREMIRFTQQHPVFREEVFWSNNLGKVRIIWHGVRLYQPDWGHASHTLAFTLQHADTPDHLHIMLNMYWEPLRFEIPLLSPERAWRCIVDTAQPAPSEYFAPAKAPLCNAAHYLMQERSIVLLMAGERDSGSAKKKPRSR